MAASATACTACLQTPTHKVSDLPQIECKLPPAVYARRRSATAATKLAWSPVFTAQQDSQAASGSHATATRRMCLLAVGTEAGIVWLWQCLLPTAYSTEAEAPQAAFEMVSQVACLLTVLLGSCT